MLPDFPATSVADTRENSFQSVTPELFLHPVGVASFVQAEESNQHRQQHTGADYGQKDIVRLEMFRRRFCVVASGCRLCNDHLFLALSCAHDVGSFLVGVLRRYSKNRKNLDDGCQCNIQNQSISRRFED